MPYTILVGTSNSGVPNRQADVLAMPVVGTGLGGARGSSGETLQRLLVLLHASTLTRIWTIESIYTSSPMIR